MTKSQRKILEQITDSFDEAEPDRFIHFPGDDPRKVTREATTIETHGWIELKKSEMVRPTPHAAAVMAASNLLNALYLDISHRDSFFSEEGNAEFREEYKMCLLALSEYLATVPEVCLVNINRRRMEYEG